MPTTRFICISPTDIPRIANENVLKAEIPRIVILHFCYALRKPIH